MTRFSDTDIIEKQLQSRDTNYMWTILLIVFNV